MFSFPPNFKHSGFLLLTAFFTWMFSLIFLLEYCQAKEVVFILGPDFID